MIHKIENNVVKRLSYDRYELKNPMWEDIETAIRQLDGLNSTLVVLSIGDPAPHLAVGGGNEDHYFVYATFDNVVFYKIVDKTSGPGKVEMVAGSQLGTYELRNCVTLNVVLQAASAFAQTGELDSQLAWEVK